MTTTGPESGSHLDEIAAMLDVVPDMRDVIRDAEPSYLMEVLDGFDATAVYDKPATCPELSETVTPERRSPAGCATIACRAATGSRWGPPLAAGRYRVTLRSLGRGGVTKPVSLTFRAPPVHLGCNAPVGEVSATTLGSVVLGERFKQAETIYGCGSRDGDAHRYGWKFSQGGAEIATASPRQLRTLAPRQRRAVAGKVIVALTSSKQLHLASVGVGSTAASVRARFRRRIRIRIGTNVWYVIPRNGGANLIELAHGRVRELGIAARSLVDGRRHAEQILRSLTSDETRKEMF